MRVLSLIVVVLVAGRSTAQQAGWPSALPITVGQPAAPPVADGVPARVVEVVEAPPVSDGQQHRFALNFALGQPSVGRVGMRVLDLPRNSLWLEAYGGSALFDAMYGFGARLQHTAFTLGQGDAFFISPGLGLQILPEYYSTRDTWRYNKHRGLWTHGTGFYSTLYYLAGDVDFSWVHDFTPRFGFELGMKLGLAGRIGGSLGDDYPSGVTWGKNLYPIVAFYSGFRF